MLVNLAYTQGEIQLAYYTFLVTTRQRAKGGKLVEKYHCRFLLE